MPVFLCGCWESELRSHACIESSSWPPITLSVICPQTFSPFQKQKQQTVVITQGQAQPHMGARDPQESLLSCCDPIASCTHFFPSISLRWK